MGDENYNGFVKPWLEWVRRHDGLWNSIRVNALLLREGDSWLNAGVLVELSDATSAEKDCGVQLGPDEGIAAARSNIPLERLPTILQGLRDGVWTPGILPEVSASIVLNVQTQILAVGDWRLEVPKPPSHFQPEALEWPCAVLECRAGSLADHFGGTAEFLRRIERLDRRSAGSGFGSISEIAMRLEIKNQEEDWSTFIRSPSIVRLLAPVRVRVASPRWDRKSNSVTCRVDVGRHLPRSRVCVFAADPRESSKPRPLAESTESTNVLSLSQVEPTEHSKVRVTLDGEILYEMQVRRVQSSVPMGAVEEEGPSKRSRRAMGIPNEFQTPFDKYTIKKQVGQGGGGRVFRVEDSSGKSFAAKVFAPDEKGSDRIKRFRNEIMFCASTRHKNLARTIDVGSAIVDGRECPFYIMEYFPKTLSDVIAEGIDPADVVRLFNEMLDGVEAAHALGVCHRDLKPKNMFVTEDGGLKIGDFGAAQFPPEIMGVPVQTETGARIANMIYAAPEQRVPRAVVDYRADLYAIGLILNEMFTRQVPLGTSYKTIASAHPSYAYLDDVVSVLTRQSPDDRFSSVSAVRERVQKPEEIERPATFDGGGAGAGTKADAGLSDAAMTLARLLVGKQKVLVGEEPVLSAEECHQIGVGPGMINDAVEELEAEGLIRVWRTMGSEFGLMFHNLQCVYTLPLRLGSEVMSYSPENDVQTVLSVIVSSGTSSGVLLLEKSGLEPLRLARAVRYLAAHGYVEIRGTDPITLMGFDSVGATYSGKRFFRERSGRAR